MAIKKYMERFLTNKSIFFRWQTLFLFVSYFVIRIISFYLHPHLVVQGILVFFILMAFGILYFKNPNWAWGLLLAEIFLGGSGHYLELLGLSLRTLLIFFFIFLWLAQLIGDRSIKKIFDIHSHINYLLLILFAFLAMAGINGIVSGHEFRQVIADIMPFSFLLLIFPSYYLFADNKTQEYLVRLIGVFIIGTALFSLITFTLFSLGITELHFDFYQWYRDVDMGKITNMGAGFFRIVEPAHILVVPLILIITSLRMRDEKHNKMWLLLLIASIIILVLNLSRGYFLALAIGLLVLKFKHTWKMWFKETIITGLLVILMFTGIHFLASGGTSPGLELFGMRLQSFTQPTIEVSTNTRMMILPIIWQTITQHPILGVGLGATITFTDVHTYEMITTPHFDWGYLEMWAEMGILGALALTFLYLYVGYNILDKIKKIHDWHEFDVGILAGIVAFLVMNITIPALFHVFGILYLVFSLTIVLKQTSIFDRTTVILYRIFNKIKS